MATGNQSGEAGSIQVVDKVGRILDCFNAASPRLRAGDIGRVTGMPTSTVARLLRTLTGGNLLQHSGGQYSIGLRVMAWSAAASAGSDLIAIAQPLVTLLRDECRESCGLYVRQGSTRVSVLQVESMQSIIYRGYVGQVMPLSAGAAGKTFMAYDATARAAAIEEGLPGFTTRTITDPITLERDLERVRRQGWAFSEEEREEGLSSLAAPIFDSSGKIVAAVAVGGPSFRLTSSEAKRLAMPVLDCANEISRGLLWRGETSAEEREALAARRDVASARPEPDIERQHP
jgi:DNA-binding IclR family transcriptional regulator